MDNPEKLATLATHDTRRRQKKTKTHHNTENYKDEQHRPHKNTGGEPVCSCLVISTSHKILVKKVIFKGIQAVRNDFLFILKVANIRCFILIGVEIFLNIIRK
jgi:hypothetical protein